MRHIPELGCQLPQRCRDCLVGLEIPERHRRREGHQQKLFFSMNSAKSLNHDILTLVIAALENKRDVVRVMKACHALEEAGRRKLLSFPITIDADNLETIHNSIITQTKNYCAHLRHLDIKEYSFSEEQIRKIAEILRHAKYLEHLNVGIQHTFMVPEFAESMSNLQNLRELQLLNPDEPLLAAVKLIKSPLVELVVVSARSELSHRTELSTLIRNFTSSLEVLRVKRVTLHDLDFQCPRLRVLYLTGLPSEFISAHKLVHAFPNLAILGLDGDGRIPETVSPDYRERNAAEPPSSPWPRLELAEGQVEYIWTLALKCPIRSLAVTWYGVGMEYEMFEDLDVTHTPTTMLLLIFPADDDQLEYFEEYFSKPPAWTETRFEIQASAFEDSDEIEDFMDRFLDMIKELHLQYIEVDFDYGEDALEDVQDWFDVQFRPKDFVRKLSQAIPCLQKAHVDFGGFAGTVWKIMESKSGRKTKLLNSLPQSDRPKTFTTDRRI